MQVRLCCESQTIQSFPIDQLPLTLQLAYDRILTARFFIGRPATMACPAKVLSQWLALPDINGRRPGALIVRRTWFSLARRPIYWQLPATTLVVMVALADVGRAWSGVVDGCR